MSQCQAYAHRYVGKGRERQKYEGPCVLEERGHDGECLPASLAYANMTIQSYNQGVTDALAKVMFMLGGNTEHPPTEANIAVANAMRDALEALKKELIAV